MSPSERNAARAIREVEHKFSVSETFELPDLSLGGTLELIRDDPLTQTAVYYDTADLALFRWGITLRRRTGGTDDGWHLKLPGRGGGNGRHVRDELQLPLTDATTPPDEFHNLLGAFVRGASLQPAVTLRTLRRVIHVRTPGGSEIAEVADDVVTVLNGAAVSTTFREIEVEVQDEAAAEELVRAVRASGAIPSSISKAAAALGKDDRLAAEVPEPIPVDAATPTSLAVSSYLGGLVRALLFADVQVRLGSDDSVHQLRVSVRRLRSALRTFAPLLNTTVADELRGELGWLADEMGPARDAEVLLERLLADAARLEQGQAIIERLVRSTLEPELAAATAMGVAALESQRHTKLVNSLITAAPLLALPLDEPAGSRLPTLVDAAFRALAKSVRALEDDGPSDDWHRARILAKRARYAAEAAVPALGEPASDRAEALELVTECLGQHQDAWLAQHRLTELAAGVDGPTGLLLGRLAAHEISQEMAARASFRRDWPQVLRTNESGWERK